MAGMIKHTVLALALLTAVPLVACDKADEQSKIDKAKAEQNQTITNANVEAEKKVNGANAEANKKIEKAEDKAADKIADVNEAMVKAKADFTKTKQDDLATLDKKLAELDAKALKATGKTKADADVALTTAHKKRDAFAAEVSSVNAVPAASWEATKTRMDDGWTDLKKSVDSVKL